MPRRNPEIPGINPADTKPSKPKAHFYTFVPTEYVLKDGVRMVEYCGYGLEGCTNPETDFPKGVRSQATVCDSCRSRLTSDFWKPTKEEEERLIVKRTIHDSLIANMWDGEVLAKRSGNSKEAARLDFERQQLIAHGNADVELRRGARLMQLKRATEEKRQLEKIAQLERFSLGKTEKVIRFAPLEYRVLAALPSTAEEAITKEEWARRVFKNDLLDRSKSLEQGLRGIEHYLPILKKKIPPVAYIESVGSINGGRGKRSCYWLKIEVDDSTAQKQVSEIVVNRGERICYQASVDTKLVPVS